MEDMVSGQKLWDHQGSVWNCDDRQNVLSAIGREDIFQVWINSCPIPEPAVLWSPALPGIWKYAADCGRIRDSESCMKLLMGGNGMQMEGFSRYQSWVDAEMECADGVRKRKWLLFWKCTGIFLAVSVAILLICFVVGMGSEEDILAMAVVGATMLFILMTFLMLICMLPGFFKGRYARKIRQAIRRQGFSDAQREQFAREQMEARRDPAKSVSVVITKGQDRMPAQFTLSEHFACLTGGTNFGPYILNVDDTEAIRISTNSITLPALTRVFFLVIKMDQSVTTHVIHFVGHGREQGHLIFGDLAVCEQVLNILRQRFPEVPG